MQRQNKPQHILIVEDDDLVAQYIALQLAELGYGVSAILPSGEEALEQTGQLGPDLILMDIMLAGDMDGIETARQIRRFANIPVVFLTDHADRELIKRALDTGPYAYLQKPLKDRELELTLELSLQRHRVEEQARNKLQELEHSYAENIQLLATSRQALQMMERRQNRDQFSLQRFSNALDDSADTIYLIDRTSMRFIDVNKTACERSGFSRAELLKMGPHDIKPYFSRQMLEQEFDKISSAKNRYGIIDTWHRCKNNDTYPVEVRLRASEADGRAIFVAIARDMTIRKQNEEALRLSEEKFRRLFENSPIGLVLANQQFSITEANPSFCNMLGYSSDELIGKSFNEITHPDDQNISTAYAHKLFTGTVTAHPREKRYLRKNGEVIWAKLNNAIVCDVNQRPLYALAMIENIDHLKQAEAKRLAHEAAQKKALVREVHHRIKNHLQGVVGLMQQHALDNRPCSGVIELAISQINAVATIHGLQGKESGEEIDLLQMLVSIRDSLKLTNPACFDAEIRVTGLSSPHLERDESVPIALALNELMVNASKHSTGYLEISLDRNADQAIIHIENQCSTTVEKPSPGSGLELVQALVQTKGAKFRYEYTHNSFLAEIILTAPVIKFH